MSSSRILLFTGEGKGKTTAALGMVLRASGHGLRSLVIQFVKSDRSTGELAGAKYLPGVEIVQTGRGFLPEPGHPEFAGHREAAARGLDLASRAIDSRENDLIVLDEICHAVAKGLLPEEEVIDAIRRAGPDTCIVLTGRGATPGLVAVADTVTEMHCRKHGFAAGCKARKGVEF